MSSSSRPLTEGTVRMVVTLTVRGVETDYKVVPTYARGTAMRSFLLRKEGGRERYRVWECSSGTLCNCEDFRRNDGHSGLGCKHVRALRAYGMVE